MDLARLCPLSKIFQVVLERWSMVPKASERSRRTNRGLCHCLIKVIRVTKTVWIYTLAWSQSEIYEDYHPTETSKTTLKTFTLTRKGCSLILHRWGYRETWYFVFVYISLFECMCMYIFEIFWLFCRFTLLAISVCGKEWHTSYINNKQNPNQSNYPREIIRHPCNWLCIERSL